MPHIVGGMHDLMSQHTSWDVMAAETELFVTFGGVPAKNAQCSPGGAGFHRIKAGLRAMAAGGARFVNIGPCSDNLDPLCQAEWIPCRPNADTALMLACAWQLVANGSHDEAFLARCCAGFERFLPYLLGETDGIAKTPAWAEALTAVPAGRIEALAREMAASRTMLNIAWSLQRAHHGEQPFWMLVTLAAMLGQIGLPGGGFAVGYGPANTLGTPHRRLPGPTLSQGTNPVEAYIPVARIADMLLNPGAAFTHNGKALTYPDIRLIYWAGGNPYHHHQDLYRFERAWQKPETVIVNEPYWTATAKRADIVLPVTTTMERNDIGYASQEGLMVAMKQASAPYGESRNDYDIFTALAQRLGLAAAFTEGRDETAWLGQLYDETRKRWSALGVEIPGFSDFWEAGLLDLSEHARSHVMFDDFRRAPAEHPLTTPSGRIEIFCERVHSFGLSDCAGHPTWRTPQEWLGSPERAPDSLHLISDQPERKLHSQLDHSPHSQAGKRREREPLYISPGDAEARGIADGDLVEVHNARGSCLAAVIVTDAMMPGVVRMATGAWYDPQEAGPEKHGNPNVLTLDIGASSLSQGCAAQTCLVQVRGPVNTAPKIAAFDPPPLECSPS
jgi:biotin/methionine sulfoxide reductase